LATKTHIRFSCVTITIYAHNRQIPMMGTSTYSLWARVTYRVPNSNDVFENCADPYHEGMIGTTNELGNSMSTTIVLCAASR